MCGRFAFYSSAAHIESTLDVSITTPINISYNLAPSMPIPIIRRDNNRSNSLSFLRWGLLPSFAKNTKQAQINARYETIHEKPFFKSSFQKRRCLVLANGWFEWEKKGEAKHPFYFSHQENPLLCFAGIWSTSEINGASHETVAILTRPADEAFKCIHPRMPLLLNKPYQTKWLTKQVFSHISDATALAFPTNQIFVYPVSAHVNSPKHQDSRCIDEI